MATVVLNAYSTAYPLITNRLRASIYRQSDPQALVASIIEATTGHPQRTYSFPGLPRDNYGFYLHEIDSSSNIVNTLAHFDAVPGEIDGELCRVDEQIIVGTTNGFVAGANSFTFDGSEISPGVFVPNYLGFDIVPSELDGRGILKKGLDYSWNKTTAVFTLLQTGDIFGSGQYYNIHFECQVDTRGNSVPSFLDFEIIVLTANTVLDETYFGKKIIAEPAGIYMRIMLPPAALIPQGRKLMIECSKNSTCCVEVISFDGIAPIKFLRGKIYLMPNEHLSIYKFHRGETDEFRVCDAYGNYTYCGQLSSGDSIANNVFNLQLLDGSLGDTNSHKRIYQEVILNLPIGQVCNFDERLIGNNKYLYSLANSANPDNENKFYFPDRRDLYERNNKTGKAGDYQENQNKLHGHGQRTTNSPPSGGSAGDPIRGTSGGDVNTRGQADNTGTGDQKSIVPSGGTESRPETYLINKYVLL